MAVTQNTYTGDGATVLFSFTFPYLETTDIKVSVGGTITTAYTLANATTIEFNTAPANGAAIRIFRQTDDADLAATFYPGSAIRSQDLNENFTQNLYVTQESSRDATEAIDTAEGAVTTANAATATANTALSTANTASSNATAAVSTANTASSNASAAVSTANTASSNASAAVSTANSAVSTANSATSTANTALSTANAASSTATTAASNATSAVSTANSALSAANSAVSTANTASSNASTALSTANTAASNASTAVSTANSAVSTANSAAAAVASAVLYQPVVDLAALALLTPTDGDFFELQDSTGAESDPSITGIPSGLVGDTGLSFRLRYDDPPGEYVFLEYFATDSETRYLKLQGGTVTGNLEIGTTGSLTFEGSTADAFETTLAVVDPTADRTITFPNVTGTVVTTGDSGTVTSAMIADGTIVDADISASAEIAVSKLADGAARQLLQTDAAGTGVEWTSNVDVPGTLDVTGATTLDSTLSVPLGSASAPSIYPGTDTNTGIYSPGADQVAISTNGTQRLFVNSTGSIGIGIASPVAQLHVNGSIWATDGELAGGNTASTGTSGTFRLVSSGGNNFFQFGQNRSTGSAAPLVFGNIFGGAEYMRITSDGKLGLGTSIPGSLLEISSAAPSTVGTTTLLQRIRSNAGNSVFLETTSRRHTVNSDWSGVSMRLQHNVDSSLMGYLEFNPSGTSQGVAIGHNNTSRLVVDSSGRVGIGTTSPGSALEINAAAATSPFIAKINTAEVARIDSSGRLLVGTSSVRAAGEGFQSSIGTQLFIEQPSSGLTPATFLLNRDDANGPRIVLGKSRGTAVGSNTIVQAEDHLGIINFAGADGTDLDTVAAQIIAVVDGTPGANDMPGRIVLTTTADGASSPTERMRINAAGEVCIGVHFATPGVGNTNAGAAIKGNGQAYFSATSDTTVFINRNTSDGAAVSLRREGTQVGSISVTTTATAYNTSSDYRLKENVVPLTGAADRLNQLQVHRFNFIADPDKTVDGFIAHEAQAVVSECVTGTKDEVDADGNPVYQGIDQSKLVPLLTAALQEALQKIEDLEGRLTAAGI